MITISLKIKKYVKIVKKKLSYLTTLFIVRKGVRTQSDVLRVRVRTCIDNKRHETRKKARKTCTQTHYTPHSKTWQNTMCSRVGEG